VVAKINHLDPRLRGHDGCRHVVMIPRYSQFRAFVIPGYSTQR
jgi:hypothetical protein